MDKIWATGMDFNGNIIHMNDNKIKIIYIRAYNKIRNSYLTATKERAKLKTNKFKEILKTC